MYVAHLMTYGVVAEHSVLASANLYESRQPAK